MTYFKLSASRSWSIASLVLVALAAGCSSETERGFAGCEPGWIDVEGVCRQKCDSQCPDGQQCTEGVCVECAGGECPSCGDGKLDDGEKCDDGNTDSGDGCADCVVEDNWQCTKAEPSTCNCANGFQDNDKDSTCAPDCANSGLDCAARGACTDASGTALCVCDPGYQDNDNADGCKPDCETAMLHCGDNAACTDKSGTATCLCDPGYQDNDEDGACLADCKQTTCGLNATCDDASGTATCSCEKAFQDNDGDGDCGEDCSEADCGPNGVCDDSSGAATCSCLAGYQDNDDKDGCLPDCETAALSCLQKQHCDDSSGTAACVCDADYQDNDGKNGCEPTCEKAPPGCGIHASCDDGSGTAACVCAPHYRDPGNDGACEVATCFVNPSSCGATKYCAEQTEECTALPKVPNGDFSCKTGGQCDVAWDLTSDVTIGNDCGSSLLFTRAAYQSASPGVPGDALASVSVPIPAYASIDPPSASAGPLALTFEGGVVCKDGPSGPKCGSQPSFPGPDLMISVDGRARQLFTNFLQPNCASQKRTVCLDQASYGHDVAISIRPASFGPPFDEPMAKMLQTVSKIALVRDASCPTPGVVPFKPGDWSGQVVGTAAAPYIDLPFSEYCGLAGASTSLSVPNTLARPAIEFEVSATPSPGGIYPQVELNAYGPDFDQTIGTYQTVSGSKVIRNCLPPWLAGKVAYYSITGTATGPCTAGNPAMVARKVAIVDATADECPDNLFEYQDFANRGANMANAFECRNCQVSGGKLLLTSGTGSSVSWPVAVPSGPRPGALLTLSRTGTLGENGTFSLNGGPGTSVIKPGTAFTSYLGTTQEQKCVPLSPAGKIGLLQMGLNDAGSGASVTVDDVQILPDLLCQ